MAIGMCNDGGFLSEVCASHSWLLVLCRTWAPCGNATSRIGSSTCNWLHAPSTQFKAGSWPFLRLTTSLANVIHERYRPMMWLLASCGLRIGEAVELRVKDLHLKRRRIRLARAMVFVRGGSPVVGPPKSGKASTVSVTPFLVVMLAELVKGRRPDDFLFTTVRGLQMQANNFKRRDFGNAVAAGNANAA
ncbi:hypothetical protein CQ017_00125 [Arthrobacter sp. MYb224]|nr:hypothetical protein CQ017_00125 [Arthrobacter sp. MYb224]